MSVFSKLRGTVETIFQIGLGGPNVKANAGAVEVRDAADAAFAITRGAVPLGADDYVTLALAAPFAVTTANYTQPAAAATVNVAVKSSNAFAVDDPVNVTGGGGFYVVTAIPDATHITIRNSDADRNAAPAAVIPTGSAIQMARGWTWTKSVSATQVYVAPKGCTSLDVAVGRPASGGAAGGGGGGGGHLGAASGAGGGGGGGGGAGGATNAVLKKRIPITSADALTLTVGLGGAGTVGGAAGAIDGNGGDSAAPAAGGYSEITDSGGNVLIRWCTGSGMIGGAASGIGKGGTAGGAAVGGPGGTPGGTAGAKYGNDSVASSAGVVGGAGGAAAAGANGVSGSNNAAIQPTTTGVSTILPSGSGGILGNGDGANYGGGGGGGAGGNGGGGDEGAINGSSSPSVAGTVTSPGAGGSRTGVGPGTGHGANATTQANGTAGCPGVAGTNGRGGGGGQGGGGGGSGAAGGVGYAGGDGKAGSNGWIRIEGRCF